jgi:hypothetical protein
MTALALLCLLGYSLERTGWLFSLFEEDEYLPWAAAVVVELAAVALLVGAGALQHIEARAWANRALGVVLSVQALANLSAGYLRGDWATLGRFGEGWAAYAVMATLWLTTNLAVPALVLFLSKLLERLIAALVVQSGVVVTKAPDTSVTQAVAPVAQGDTPVSSTIHFPLTQSGFIYLLRAETGHYKIGRAKNVENRIRSIAAFVPFRVELAHTIATDDTVRLERCLHFLYERAGKRVNGEWFNLSPLDVAAIQAIGGELNTDTMDDTLDALALTSAPPPMQEDEPVSDDPLELARNLRQQGVSWREVARKVGISDATLRRKLDGKMGVAQMEEVGAGDVRLNGVEH